MKLKKRVSIILALVTLISVFCMPSMFSHAANATGLGIADETVYYIMNGSNQKLLAPNSDSPSNYVGVTLWPSQTWSNPRTKWLVDKQSNGKFKLISFSGSGLTLRSYESYVEVDSEESDGSCDFDIIRVGDDATLVGMFYIKWGTKYLSKASVGDTVVLSEGKTESSYWTFMAVTKRNASLYYFNHNRMNTTANVTTFQNNFDAYGYEWSTVANPEYAEAMAGDYLLEDDIYIFAGYGTVGEIELKDENGNVIGSVVADYETWYGGNEYYIDLPYNALANSRCVLLLGTCTGSDVLGKDGEYYNLVDTIYSYGAHYVMGFNSHVSADNINLWLTEFLNSINCGKNISEAVSEAGLGSYIYSRGDGRQYLNFGVTVDD